MKRGTIVVTLGALMAVAFLSQPIFAQKVFLDEFKKVYPGVDAKLAKCTTCHTPEGQDKPGKKNLNAYGKEIQGAPEAKVAMGKEGKPVKYTADDLKAVNAAIKAVGSKDSNGNGKTNDEDIKAGNLPGSK
jgi:mono/diheme cytochrome c family protein